MKKLLIATAALAMVAGTAQAQSSVTVYGVLDIGYSDTNNKLTNADGTSAKNAVTSTGNGDGGLATSRLGFRGTEDLGGGMKANFVLEYDLVDSGSQSTTAGELTPSTTTSAFGARYSWVGLEDAKLGQLRLGRQESSAHSVVVGGSAGGGNNVAGTVYSAGGNDTSFKPTAALGSSFDTSQRPHAVFVNKAVTYISPVMSGVRFELQHAKIENETSGVTQQFSSTVANTAAAKMDRTVDGASLKYNAGKLALAYGYQQIKNTTLSAATTDKYKVDVVSGSYDFGMAKVFALYSSGKDTGNGTTSGTATGKTTNTEVGVQVPVGKTVLFASMFDGETKFADVAVGTAETKSDTGGYQAGAIYSLSKRTALYGIYGKQEVKATGAATGFKMSTDQLSAGVRHSF
jgi:predicted porin